MTQVRDPAGNAWTGATGKALNRLAAETWTDPRIGGSRKTTYGHTFHPNNVLASLTVTRPLPGPDAVTVCADDSFGNLASVTNALGHVATWSGHNGPGLPGRPRRPDYGRLPVGACVHVPAFCRLPAGRSVSSSGLTTVDGFPMIARMSNTTMRSARPETLRTTVDQRMRCGDYGNTSKYLRGLIRRDLQEQARKRLRALIEEGLRSVPPGEPTASAIAGIHQRIRVAGRRER